MKKSMQIIAMAAFLGCFAILAIAAGSEKARSQEGCGEEWQDVKEPVRGQAIEKEAAHQAKEVAAWQADHTDELIFPAQLFHKMI